MTYKWFENRDDAQFTAEEKLWKNKPPHDMMQPNWRLTALCVTCHCNMANICLPIIIMTIIIII